MGKIITVASQKGGVGKTTTVLNLGYSLAQLGQQVLLADTDPQGGLTLATNLKKKSSLGLVHVTKQQAALQDVIFHTNNPSLSVLGMGEIEPADILRYENEAKRKKLAMLIHSLRQHYDYVIVDAPSGAGYIATSLVAVSNGVILPVTCRALALKTLPALLKLIGKIRDKMGNKLQLEGILATMVDANSTTELELLEDARTTFPESAFFRTQIPRHEAFERASIHTVPVALMPGADSAMQSYMNLAYEFKQRELLQQGRGEIHEQIEGLF